MDTPGKKSISRRMLTYEIIAFALIILTIWSNEIIDIPAMFFGAEVSPLNWQESIFESTLIIIIAVFIINFTRKIFQRMKYLEGFLPVCSYCKKIRDEKGNWQQIEAYIHARSEAEFSHGICPECAAKYFPDDNPYKEDDPGAMTTQNPKKHK